MNSHALARSGKPAARAAATKAVPRFVDDYLPALLAQASQLISSEFHRIVAAEGFTVSEWRVLATLAGGRPLAVGRLAQVSVTKQPTVTRLLDRMAARGHVERLPNGSGDRRVTLVRITAGGDRLVARLIELARAHEQRVLRPLGRERSATLKATLRALIEEHRPHGAAYDPPPPNQEETP